MDEDTLPTPFKDALKILRSDRMPDARVDAIQANWAYLWLPDVKVDQFKFPPPETRGMWVRLPVQFPHANPHGIITKEALVPSDGHIVKGQNENHDTGKPVAHLGGRFYYSWTWSGQEMGNGPSLQTPADIVVVVTWIESRIRKA